MTSLPSSLSARLVTVLVTGLRRLSAYLQRYPALPGVVALRLVLAHWVREQRALRQGLLALGFSTGVGIGAGLVLGAIGPVLAEFPGLLILVPAAIGIRGAIFGALGARLGTGILTGQYEQTLRPGTFTRANVEAAAVLTFASGALAALLARAVGTAFGQDTIPLWDLMVVSLVGGVIASTFLMGGVLGLAGIAQRRGLDMDAVGSPLITATGDVVTLPALVAATLLLGNRLFDTVLGVALLGIALLALDRGIRRRPDLTRRVVLESLPVLCYTAIADILAGTVLQTRLEEFVTSDALLVLVPPFIASCGSLGGILSARLSSGLHLGLLAPRLMPQRQAWLEGSIVVAFALAAFTGVGVLGTGAAALAGYTSPGVLRMIAIALSGGLLATGVLFVVGYATATISYHFGLDPDNYGIPIVTATMDFLGILCLVVGITTFGGS